jgi:hypothetical protein
VNSIENKENKYPSELSEKLNRNEGKLEQAWKLHKESASTLCNLLDESTTGGWKMERLVPTRRGGLAEGTWPCHRRT